jgi:hypothetical protein
MAGRPTFTAVLSSPVRNRLVQHAPSTTALRVAPVARAASGEDTGRSRASSPPAWPGEGRAAAAVHEDFIVHKRYIVVFIVSRGGPRSWALGRDAEMTLPARRISDHVLSADYSNA